MTLATTITETVKTLFQKASGLRELEAQELLRKEAERIEERASAHRDLVQAKEQLNSELPELETAVEKDRARVDRARASLAEAEKALAASSATRFGRAAELRGAITRHEEALRRTAPPELTEFRRWLSSEFEKLRLAGDHHISSGIDPSTGSPAVWIRSNSRAITSKLDRIEAAHKRVLELELELGDPADEIEKLKASIDAGGLEIEQIKGRFGEPIPPPYDRYEQRKQSLPSDPPRREHW